MLPHCAARVQLPRGLSPRLGDEDPRYPQPIEGFNAHGPTLDFHPIAQPRATAEPAQHVATEGVVDVLVDVQAELVIDVRDQRQSVHERRAVSEDGYPPG